MQFDLEEGEIPEFEVEPLGSNNKEMLLRSRMIPRDLGRNKKEPNRYGSPPSEGEYISEEEIVVERNRMSRKDMYRKNFHPAHPTYGSVEDIMTKIGESLGRHSNYYCKGRRSKEPRYVITINEGRDVKSVLRESSPFLKRLNYCNYRRHSETNFESVNNIGEKYGKMKYKKLFDARRSEKGCPKKRKRDHGKINEDGTDRSKKLRFFDEREKQMRERCKKQRKHKLDMKIVKEIPMVKSQKPEVSIVKEMPKSEDSNCLVDNTKDAPSHIVQKSDLVGSPGNAALDNESAVTSSTHDSKQSNGGGDDDDDDDTELIKLRILALTSNKKKGQSTADNCLDDEKDLAKSAEENVLDDFKSDLVDDDEKTKGRSPPASDDAVKERRSDNEIDRYELFLRAEALKTALLKKHQRLLIKRKKFGAISRNRKGTGSGDSNGNELVKRDELDLDLLSDEELMEKNQGGDLGAQLEVTENYEKPGIKDESRLDSESSKEGILITGINQEDGLPLENLEAAEGVGCREENSDPTPKLDNALNTDAGTDSKITPTGPQSGKKKFKRVKVKQTKKSVDSSETNIRENSLACKEVDDRHETESGYSVAASDENKVQPEEKFVLVDMGTSSGPGINASSNNSNGQPSTDAKQNHKSVVNQKPIALNNEELASKIPETERIIVHLGSDSSDDESVPDCQSHKKSDTVVNEQSKEVNPSESVDSQNNLEEFERSVELLLRGARRKIERRKELLSGIPSTPEAVYSHLAPSQRLEYIRLKQKIAEREKLRRAENVNSNNPPVQKGNKIKVNSIGDKSIGQINNQNNIGQGPAFGLNARGSNVMNKGDVNKGAQVSKNQITVKEMKNSPNKNLATRAPNYGAFGNNKTARVVQFSNARKLVSEPNSQRGAAITLKKDFAESSSRNTIKTGPSEIVIERKKMLNQNRLHLERLKILWKNIKIEKMIEARYEKEIKKLKMQQNLFELKVSQQRSKIKKLADESQQIYEAFQKNNRRVAVISKKRKIVVPKTENEEKKARYSDKNAAGKVGAERQESGKRVAEKEKESREDTAEKVKENGEDIAGKNKENGRDAAEKEKESREDTAEKVKENGEDIAEKNKENRRDAVEKERESRDDTVEKVKENREDIAEKNKENSRDDAVEKEKENREDTVGKVKENREDTVEKEQENGKDTSEKDKESGEEIGKEVIPDRVESDVRLIAMDTEIVQREDVEANAEEKVNTEIKYDVKQEVTVTNKSTLLTEYNSPLQIVADGSESSSNCPRIDPNVILCQYDLLGKCNDEECAYQHLWT